MKKYLQKPTPKITAKRKASQRPGIKAAMLVNAYTKESYMSDKMAHMQDIINKSRVLWVNPNEEKSELG